MQICKTVTLRTRKCKKGMLSYYLDYYPCYRDRETMETIRHESLGIYVYEKPKTKQEIAFNKTMKEKAEAIRCRRYEVVINERYDLFDRVLLKQDFLAYYEKEAQKHNQKWMFVYAHFKDYVKGKCLFEEVDVALCRGFGEYLQNDAKSKQTGKKLAQNSIAGYWSTFRGFLKVALKSKKINENINDYLDRIDTEDTYKESLTLEEIYTLYNTECEEPVLKRGALFSCLTGLRYSDVEAMTWDKVQTYADGGKYLDFLCVKTGKRCIVPINKDVLKLMGRKGKGVVFEGLKYTMTQQPMKNWLKDAGITKHITFHSFRHTYATLQVELGTDIYTVQSLLGHANVTTTEIYARHAEAKNREAAAKISLKVLEKGSTEKPKRGRKKSKGNEE